MPEDYRDKLMKELSTPEMIRVATYPGLTVISKMKAMKVAK